MVPYVYRRPHDYRALVSQRPLLYPPQTAQVLTFKSPRRLIISSGVFRQGFTPVLPQTFFQPALDGFGANSSLSFSASGTLSGSTDPTAIILAFNSVARDRGRWYRERWDDTPVRAFNPIFSSWNPTGEALMSFSASGTMLAIVAGQMVGATSLAFTTSANTNNVSLIAGQTSLSFSASLLLPATILISGSTSLTFTLPPVNVPTLQGVTSLSFSAQAATRAQVRRITMRISHPRIAMEIQ